MGFCSHETSTVVLNQEASPDPQSSMVMAIDRQIIQRYSRMAGATCARRSTAGSRQTNLIEETLHKNGELANRKVARRVMGLIPKRPREGHKRQHNGRNTIPTMGDMVGVSELASEVNGHCKVVQLVRTVEGGQEEGPSQNHAQRARSGRTLGDMLRLTLPQRSRARILKNLPAPEDHNTDASSAMVTVHQRTGPETGASSKPAWLPQSRKADAPTSRQLMASSHRLSSCSQMPTDGKMCMALSTPSDTQEKGGMIVSSSSSSSSSSAAAAAAAAAASSSSSSSAACASSSPSLQELHQRTALNHSSAAEIGQACAPSSPLISSISTCQAPLVSQSSSSPPPPTPLSSPSFRSMSSISISATLPSFPSMQITSISTTLPSFPSMQSTSILTSSCQPLSSSTLHHKENVEGPTGWIMLELQTSADRNTAQVEDEAQTAPQISDPTSASGNTLALSPRLPLSSFLAERQDQVMESVVWDTWEEPTEQLDPLCCVCMVGLKGAAFIPCGHTFCRKCSREIRKGRSFCPLCNRCIWDILDIF